MNEIKYKDTLVKDKSELISKYGKGEFDSPFRSTIPLIELVYEEKLLKELLGYGSNAKFVFELETHIKKGKASCTDLVISDEGKSCFIEAKRTEPQYETVKKWLEKTKRDDVLLGWLNYIHKRCNKKLEIQDVNDIVYQMVHRFASACKDEAKTELVYILFNPKKKGSYIKKLSEFKKLVGNNKNVPPIKLIVLDIKKNELEVLQQRWEKKKERNLSEEIRQILIEESPVMSFEVVEEIRF